MILIDSELPDSCGNCPCCQPDAHYMTYTCGVEETDVMDDETGEMLSERPSWCPMKEFSLEEIEKAFKEAGKKMSTVSIPHTYFKALSVKKAVEVIRRLL